LQLGATFDPIILGYVRSGSGLADPAQALSWYRRASDLGIAEAEERIKRVESTISAQDNRSR
jgi:TPR repeat protein